MLEMRDIVASVENMAEDYPIKTVTLFGSYADGNQTENSDVDLLVEFQEPNVSLFMLSGLQIKMEELLGKSVDLVHAPLPEDTMLDIGRTVQIYEA